MRKRGAATGAGAASTSRIRNEWIWVALLRALGASRATIAAETGLHPASISRIMSRPEIEKAADDFALAIGREAIQRAADRLASVAVAAAAPQTSGARMPTEQHFFKASTLIATVLANSQIKRKRARRSPPSSAASNGAGAGPTEED